MISSNPCRKVVIPKLDANGKLMTKKEKQIYTKEQIKEFMQMIETAPLKYKVFFKLAVYTGCRRGELLGLEWKDIDFDEQVIYVHQTSNYTADKGVYTDGTKTLKSTRTVNMPSTICELLKEYKSEQEKYKTSIGDQWVENDRLFIKWNGEPMHPNTPYTWLMRECERNNFPFYGIHTFRHLFASIEIEAGIDPTTVAATLGHSTPITTMSPAVALATSAGELFTPTKRITLPKEVALTVTAVTLPPWVVTETSMPLLEPDFVTALIAAISSCAILFTVLPLIVMVSVSMLVTLNDPELLTTRLSNVPVVAVTVPSEALTMPSIADTLEPRVSTNASARSIQLVVAPSHTFATPKPTKMSPPI